jgi:general secretion pathway protein N
MAKVNLTPYVVLGIAAYAVFLVATLPASVALTAAQRAQPGRFDVLESRGSAWNGSAKVAVGTTTIERLQWRWKPARLIAGRLAFDITASAPGIEARYEGARSFTRWEVRDVNAKGSAQAMSLLLPLTAAWRPEGQLTLASPLLESDGRELRGDVSLEWRGAAVALSDVRPLGSYRADIALEGPGARFRVATLQGPLTVTGQGTLAAPGRIAFTGEARPEPTSAAALEPLLKLLGPARADGARAIEWRGP